MTVVISGEWLTIAHIGAIAEATGQTLESLRNFAA
jgi:hypothetical protein